MILSVMLFAGLAERFGATLLDVEILSDRITVTAFKEQLMSLYPEHASYIQPCFMAKNQAYAGPDELIEASDELALIPPVSGGQEADDQSETKFVITLDPIIPDETLRKVLHNDHGASLSFVGTTREFTAGLRTVMLEYECYVPMAIKTMQQIESEIQQQWPGTHVAITHRIGAVAIGEISVVIAVSSPHREMCYSASKYAIERLKEIVPIWKKEVWEDGSEWKGSQSGR